jgi:hypothetical protein
VDLGLVRVDADLHRLDAELAIALPFALRIITALVLSLTEKRRLRACSTISNRSLRRKISPPLKTRKKTPASAS